MALVSTPCGVLTGISTTFGRVIPSLAGLQTAKFITLLMSLPQIDDGTAGEPAGRAGLRLAWLNL